MVRVKREGPFDDLSIVSELSEVQHEVQPFRRNYLVPYGMCFTLFR